MGRKKKSKEEKEVHKHMCDKCPYSTNRSDNFKRHKRLHSEDKTEIQSKIKCHVAKCSRSFTNLNHLDNHLIHDHSIELKTEKHVFQSKNDFKNWRNSLQEYDSVSFSRWAKYKSGTKVFLCNRSSMWSRAPQGKNLRHEKVFGSIVCETVCRSRMIVKYDQDDNNKCTVTFLKTHTGHEIEPGRARLTSPQKKAVASEIAKGVPTQQILENSRRKGFKYGRLRRIHLLNRQDIVNIARKYKLSSSVQLHENDATSIDLTVKMLNKEGSDVFLYKRKGVLDPNYPTLPKGEFLLGYMTSHQQEMLKLYGDNIVCIDGTHGTNNYKYELTTVIVINKSSEAFPVLFVYHSSKSQQTYDLIFEKVKEKVGTIRSKVFMSDDESTFYKAWEKSMGSVQKKLLCTWHVLRNWNKHLGANNDHRDEVWQSLKDIIVETEMPDFERRLEDLDLLLKSDKKLLKFRSYFQNYLKRRLEWAGVYRLHEGINTNMSLENLHRELKHTFMKGKKAKRLDKSFAAVRALLENRHYDRLIEFNRGKISTKQRKIRASHKESLRLSTTNVVYSGEYYMVAASKNINSHYKIIKVKENCGCKLRCFKCNECAHSYQCSCTVNAIRSVMCKHIHLLIRFLKENKNGCNDDDDIDDDNLYIVTSKEKEERHAENLIHLDALSDSNTTSNNTSKNIDFSQYYSFLREIEKSSPEERKIVAQAMDILINQIDIFRGPRIEKIKEVDLSKTLNVEQQARFDDKKGKKRKSCNNAAYHESRSKQKKRLMSFHPVEPEDDDFK